MKTFLAGDFVAFPRVQLKCLFCVSFSFSDPANIHSFNTIYENAG